MDDPQYDYLMLDKIKAKGLPGINSKKLIDNYMSNETMPNNNLATFCTTKMDIYADELMNHNLNINAIDKSCYPKLALMEESCINILAHLWNLPDNQTIYDDYIGTSTVGSSEGCMLGGLALLMSWKNRAKSLGIDVNNLNQHKPNLILASNYQVVWEKFCNYWDVEMRQMPIDTEKFSMKTENVENIIDENTIGIIGIQGNTYTGNVDNIQNLDSILTKYNKNTKLPVYIHVDAAIGGMICPFFDEFNPWDFKLENVVSINTSGHKYGMVYPGIGWVIWRQNSENILPKQMRFKVEYLGKKVDSIGLNFSHSGSHIVGQYYNFLHFGFSGYRNIIKNTRKVSSMLNKALEKYHIFKIINSGAKIPINCWTVRNDANVNFDLYDLENELSKCGWKVPAYKLPGKLDNVIVSRVVVRPAMSEELMQKFIDDLDVCIYNLYYK